MDEQRVAVSLDTAPILAQIEQMRSALSDLTCTSIRHNFEAAWSGKEEDGYGVIFCTACGEIRRIEEPSIGPPAEEVTTYRDGVPKVWKG